MGAAELNGGIAMSPHRPSKRLVLWFTILSSVVPLSACAQPDDPQQRRQTGSGDSPVASAHALPRSGERQAERDDMVRRQIQARDVTDEAVLRAMRAVPRHWFVPERVARDAYADHPLPIGHEQTISQPYIVAFMTQAVKLTPDSKVLEIGTGSGYQAAVLAEITPHVYTIEIVEPLAKEAIETFKKRGYTSIQTMIGDGYAGWPEHAPFDAVIVTCAAGHVPPKLFEQLKPGGRMCIPVGEPSRMQWLQLVTKGPNGEQEISQLMPVRFVPMTGEAEKGDTSDAKPK